MGPAEEGGEEVKKNDKMLIVFFFKKQKKVEKCQCGTQISKKLPASWATI